MREVFASYYSPEFTRGAHGSFMDGFAIRMSVITQRDLTDFFEHWEYPMSSSAAAAIRGYGFETWLPEGWWTLTILRERHQVLDDCAISVCDLSLLPSTKARMTLEEVLLAQSAMNAAQA